MFRPRHKIALIACISVVCVAVLLLANLGFILSVLNKISFPKDKIYYEIEEKTEARLRSGVAFNLLERFPEFSEVCVLPTELDPESVIRQSFPDSQRINAYGWVMGWNENNWHIVFMSKSKSVTLSIGRDFFPLHGEGACGGPDKLVLDKSNEKVVVLEK
jgi:hypothetical protein